MQKLHVSLLYSFVWMAYVSCFSYKCLYRLSLWLFYGGEILSPIAQNSDIPPSFKVWKVHQRSNTKSGYFKKRPHMNCIKNQHSGTEIQKYRTKCNYELYQGYFTADNEIFPKHETSLKSQLLAELSGSFLPVWIQGFSRQKWLYEDLSRST